MKSSQNKSSSPLDSPDLSTARLRGKQSVRTTFKLPARSIDALSILATQLGIKQKSLFDHLMEDLGSLQAIAQNAGSFKTTSQPRVPRTYVVSRSTLENLERVSKNMHAPRDIVVELCIKQLLPVLMKEREKHAKRKMLLAQLQRHHNHANKIRETAKALLGTEDPVFEKIADLVEIEKSINADIHDTVRKGEAIENF